MGGRTRGEGGRTVDEERERGGARMGRRGGGLDVDVSWAIN
jgi:hypothetical protein